MGNPIIVYNETVSKASPACEGKSPNRHNSFFIKVEPLEQSVYDLIEKGDMPLGRLKKKNVEMNEKLVGNQHKLDKNHNGEIDAQDFKILKGKKVQKESVQTKKWVKNLVENKYFHNFTSKNEIMQLIKTKLNESETLTHEFGPKVKKGHNGIPEFMTYEQAPAPSKPGTDAPVREKPTTKPGKPKRENPFEPKHNPKPKAEGNEGLPEFLKFDKLGIKFKNSK